MFKIRKRLAQNTLLITSVAVASWLILNARQPSALATTSSDSVSVHHSGSGEAFLKPGEYDPVLGGLGNGTWVLLDLPCSLSTEVATQGELASMMKTASKAQRPVGPASDEERALVARIRLLSLGQQSDDGVETHRIEWDGYRLRVDLATQSGVTRLIAAVIAYARDDATWSVIRVRRKTRLASPISADALPALPPRATVLATRFSNSGDVSAKIVVSSEPFVETKSKWTLNGWEVRPLNHRNQKGYLCRRREVDVYVVVQTTQASRFPTLFVVKTSPSTHRA